MADMNDDIKKLEALVYGLVKSGSGDPQAAQATSGGLEIFLKIQLRQAEALERIATAQETLAGLRAKPLV